MSTNKQRKARLAAGRGHDHTVVRQVAFYTFERKVHTGAGTASSPPR